MMNLFSIFDPNLSLLHFNWMMMILPLFFMFKYWIISCKLSSFIYNSFSTLKKELNSIVSSTSLSSILILIALFIFILSSNFPGLFPFMFTSTSHIMITLSLALPVWLMTMLFSWAMQFNLTAAHLVPVGTPIILMPFMVLIETISGLIRPITLSLRLAANMVAGHLLITLLSSLNYKDINYMVYILGFMLCCLEMAVSIIQSYVFMTLCSLYISEIK